MDDYYSAMQCSSIQMNESAQTPVAEEEGRRRRHTTICCWNDEKILLFIFVVSGLNDEKILLFIFVVSGLKIVEEGEKQKEEWLLSE